MSVKLVFYILANLLVLNVFTLVSAQFNFFEQMFGQGHAHQQQRGPSTSQWSSQADLVPCNTYLCPDTLVCVQNPADCPCPNVEDIRCLVPDAGSSGAATVVCTRGSKGCAEVENLMSKWR